MEGPRGPGGDGGGQRHHQPLPAGEPGPREDRQDDAQVGQRDEEDQGQDQPALQAADGGGFGVGVGCGGGGRGGFGGVAGCLDGFHQVVDGQLRGCGDVSPFGSQNYRGRYPVDFAQPLLHAGGAGGAGHSADDQLELGRLEVGGGGGGHKRQGTTRAVDQLGRVADCAASSVLADPGSTRTPATA